MQKATGFRPVALETRFFNKVSGPAGNGRDDNNAAFWKDKHETED